MRKARKSLLGAGAIAVVGAFAAVGAYVAPASAADATPEIVGGTRASIEFRPYVVQLTDPSGFQFCGGSLIAPNKVLTAAHCTEGSAPNSIKVVSGREDKESDAGTVSDVTDVWVHPDYGSAASAYDVSVLTLSADVSEQPIEIASPEDAALYEAGEDATILGWGTTSEGGSASRYLRKVTVPVVSDADCKAAYPDFQEGLETCAGLPEGGKDSCQGDSGGPEVAGFRGKLIGVVSWGNGCARPDYPGVYAKVSAYYDEIMAQVNS